MILNSLCYMYDEVAENYSAPILFANDKAAVRWFANKPDDDNTKKDIKLYEIGTFDAEKGKITLHEEPVLLARGDQFNEQA